MYILKKLPVSLPELNVVRPFHFSSSGRPIRVVLSLVTNGVSHVCLFSFGRYSFMNYLLRLFLSLNYIKLYITSQQWSQTKWLKQHVYDLKVFSHYSFRNVLAKSLHQSSTRLQSNGHQRLHSNLQVWGQSSPNVMQPMLASNSRSSGLNLPGAEITGICHDAQVTNLIPLLKAIYIWLLRAN